MPCAETGFNEVVQERERFYNKTNCTTAVEIPDRPKLVMNFGLRWSFLPIHHFLREGNLQAAGFVVEASFGRSGTMGLVTV